jgi:polyhydroxybutyrate depolymerase
VSPLVAARPYAMYEPSHHDARAPLVVLLHGFGDTHAGSVQGLGMAALADEHGAFLAAPDGTRDAQGRRFWNGTDACCDFTEPRVDDVAYVDAIIDDAIAHHPIDPSRVYLMGFSNGGFMSHRYACERAERVAAIVSFSGATWRDASRCTPKVPVSVLEVHGDADAVVLFAGGSVKDGAFHGDPAFANAGAYPGAAETVQAWAKLDGCGDGTTTTPLSPRDQLTRYTCPKGVEASLWTRGGAGHLLGLTKSDMEHVWEFLARHSR